MTHQNAHSRGYREPGLRKRLSRSGVGRRKCWKHRRLFSCALSHPADVTALSSHATVIEVDVVLHRGAGGRWLPALSMVGGARVWELGERAVDRRAAGRRPGRAGRGPAVPAARGRRQDPDRPDPVQRRHRQRRRRHDRLRRSRVRRARRQRRGLVRDRHPRRQRRRLQAGLLLRRQLGHGRRRLPLAAQVRSDEHERAVSVRASATPSQHAMECSVCASQSQHCIDYCRKLVPNGCDCFGCCVVPGAPTPIRLVPTCTAKDFGDPDEVLALHAGHAVHDPVRPLRALRRQGHAAGRLRRPTAARPTPARAARRRVGSTASTPALCPADTGCITGCCRVLVN